MVVSPTKSTLACLRILTCKERNEERKGVNIKLTLALSKVFFTLILVGLPFIVYYML